MTEITTQTSICGIHLELVRKDIKHFHIRIYPPNGFVRVIVPTETPDEKIRVFVLNHKGWIKDEQNAYINQPRLKKSQSTAGDIIYLWGEKYRLNVAVSNKNTIEVMGNQINLYVKENTSQKQIDDILNEWYRAALKKEIPNLIKKWEPVLGVIVKDFGVKNMKTRWGTCSQSSGKIWLNLQLAKKPLAGLEYVVVHEMIHFKERNHTNAFREELTRCLPFWRDVRRELNACVLEYMGE